MENSMTTFQKIEQGITLLSSNSTGTYLKGLRAESKGDICTPTFTAHGQKVETAWMSTHEQTDRQNAVYPYAGYYSVLKRKKF